MPGPKTYYNPVNGEYTRILESSEDTNGAYSLLEVSLSPGGGNLVHYHTRFTEEFTAVTGNLGLRYEKEIVHLKPGESKLVPIGTPHRFFNDTAEAIVFRVVLRPGQPGFENFLKVMFGLVNDGKTITKNQIPKNIYHIAVLYEWGDTHLASQFFRLFSPMVTLFYKGAIRMGVDKELLERYAK
ncbi:cupin [Flavobacterium album]|uniref:Cupin n=2 Tax=Flavobacterium album TaxID=2175091 RepID=A0A2S1R259_9FLAO|nr:cupin [Flavobacterium album]